METKYLIGEVVYFLNNSHEINKGEIKKITITADSIIYCVAIEGNKTSSKRLPEEEIHATFENARTSAIAIETKRYNELIEKIHGLKKI